MKRIRTRLSIPSEPLSGRIVVTGANGMLGWDLGQVLGPLLPGSRLVLLDRSALDITRPEQVAHLREYRPSVVINSAAYTNVDHAEREREAAYAVNVRGVAHLASFCREMGARLVHFSSDQVFDGSGSTPWRETDPPRPCNWYAETKHLGEVEALKNEDALVLRVQWLYGQRKDRFTILRGKETFSPFADQCGAPTWSRDIARAVVALVARGAQGLYHFSYDDYASWADVFQFVKEELQLSTRLIPRKTQEARLPARRPLFSVLSNRKLVEFLCMEGMGSWKDPLGEFLKSR